MDDKCKCGEQSGGWPYEMCQDCWEAYCDMTWWKEVENLSSNEEE
jgi:hypothetical protein